MQGVQNDETAFYNAQEMVATCQEYSENPEKLSEIYTPTPEIEETPST